MLKVTNGPDEKVDSSPINWVSEIINGLADLIYPPSCTLCHRVSSAEICSHCRGALIPLSDNVCPKCGDPTVGSEPCPYCLAIEYHFDKAISLYLYEEPLRDAILDFKYHRAERKGRALAGLFGEGFRVSSLANMRFDAVVPVPLTYRKARQRSYNQSEILAYGIADATSLPVIPFALMKKRETPSQTGFDLKGRLSNVEDSFTIPDASIIKGKHILLVDDIITTGTTVSECAKVLKDAGARKVVAVSLARVVLWQ